VSHFKDYFSRLAATYAAYRPVQPPALLDWVVSLAPRRAVAWDCATGNGQAAHDLAARFDHVVATDASAAQIALATPHPRVEYRVAAAESSGIAAGTIDLVTVAQAIHWFDIDAFHREVRRVLAPGGALAVWSYMHPHIDDPDVDAIFRRFSLEALGPYWPPERRLITDGYRTIPFPFDEVEPPPFALAMHWTLDELAGYLRSWSATSRYVAMHDRDPVASFEAEVRDAWGGPDARHTVHWQYAIRAGY
jgi:SAM-dependent methyltransferase